MYLLIIKLQLCFSEHLHVKYLQMCFPIRTAGRSYMYMYIKYNMSVLLLLSPHVKTCVVLCRYGIADAFAFSVAVNKLL